MRDDGQGRTAGDGTEGDDRTDPGVATRPGAGTVEGPPWLHGTWQVRHLDGRALADGLQGPAWLTLEGDGVVFGYAGVNRVRGTWRLDGATLSFGPVVATRMAGPDEATETETAVLGLLGTGGAVTAGDGRATVLTTDGRTFGLARVDP